MDAQWNDDFHHALHVAMTGERTGYYVDYCGVGDLARALDEGFVLQDTQSTFRRRRHGAPSGHLPPERFVVFSQNHDQIGNRPLGNRLITTISPEQYGLVAALVILSPNVPMLFMGEEYGERAPFPYFVDHSDPALIDAVQVGRAQEFKDIASASELFDPRIPPLLTRLDWTIHYSQNPLIASCSIITAGSLPCDDQRRRCVVRHDHGPEPGRRETSSASFAPTTMATW